jgi:NTE family protein
MVSKEKKLTVEDFIGQKDVVNCLSSLRQTFPGDKLVVSDVLDDKGNQYVDLVQKGGGVWGIALVGYTYVLEEMGIRFMKLAGTSAGAINTAMLTSIGTKQDAKSKTVLQMLCDLDMFSFVDGHPFARRVIKKFITNKDFAKRIKSWLAIMAVILVFLIVGSMASLGLQHAYPAVHYVTIGIFVLLGIYIVLLGAIASYFVRLMNRLKNSGFGINPGDVFYDWVKKQMADHDVSTVQNLRDKASQPIPGLHLRGDRKEGVNDLKGSVALITSEIVTENKIQFPEMCDLFRPKDKEEELKPAGFVRASMSIPVFFESYYINRIPVDDPEVKAAWESRFQVKEPPTTTRFVDGGLLSNFPLNLFYNPNVHTPRLPTFGIDLIEIEKDKESKDPKDWSFGSYLGKMFNTIRDYYDKDFLLKNRILEKGVGKVNMTGYNWLNFFMSDEDKLKMFAIGAQAAAAFLKEYKWDKFKENREEYFEKMNAHKIEIK